MSSYSSRAESGQSGVEDNLQRTYSKFLSQSPLKREDISSLYSYTPSRSSRINDQGVVERNGSKPNDMTQVPSAGQPGSLEHIELREEAINRTSILMLEESMRQVKALKSEIMNSTQTIQRLEDENRSLGSDNTKLREDYIKLKKNCNEQIETIKNYETDLSSKNRIITRQSQELDSTKTYLTNSLNLEKSKHEDTRKELSSANIAIDKLNVELSTIKANFKDTCEELKHAKDESEMEHNNNEMLKSDMFALQKKLESLQAENDALHKFRESVSDYSEVKSENGNLKREIEKLDQELERLSNDLGNVSQENSGLKAQVNGLREAVESLTFEKNDMTNKSNRLQEDLIIEKSKSTEMEKNLDLEKKKSADLEKNIKDLENKMESVSAKLDDAELLSKQRSLEIKTLENENEVYASKVKSSERAVVEINNALAEIFDSPDSIIPTDTDASIDVKGVLDCILSGINQLNQDNIVLRETTVPKKDYEMIDNELREANGEVENYKNQVEEMKNHIGNIESDMDRIKLEKEEALTKYNNQKSISDEQSKQIKTLDDIIADLKEDKKANAEKLNAKEEQVKSLENDLTIANGKMEEYKYKEENYNNIINSLNTKNNDLNRTAEFLTSKLEKLEKESEKDKANVSKLNDYRDTQDKYIESLVSNHSRIRSDLEKAVGKLTSENMELKTRLSETEATLQKERDETLEKAKKRIDFLNERAIREEDLNYEIQTATPGSSISTRARLSTTRGGNVSFAPTDDGTSQNCVSFGPGTTTPILDNETRSSRVQDIMRSPSPKQVLDISAYMTNDELKALIEDIDKQRKE